ncbi:MAG: cache domain-containing protein [Azoarcus sp.]|jgi:methyl-accepting chemotaxis protein|nr:cache domain-containing protein [Azoarcus sp.]
MSPRQRLFVFIAALLVMVTAVLSSIAYWQMRTELIKDIHRELETSVHGNRAILESWATQRLNVIEAIAARLPLADDPIPFLIAGKEAGRFMQTFVGYAVEEPEKRMIYNLPDRKPVPGYDPTARSWFKDAMTAKGAIFTEPYVSVRDNELCVSVVQRINSRTPSAIGADISLAEIVELVNAIELRTEAYAFLTTRDGRIVAYSKPDATLRHVAGVITGFDVSIIKAATDKAVVHELDLDGIPKYVVASLIPGADWVLCIVVDKAAVLSPLRPLLWGLMLVGLVVALLSALIASQVSSRLLRK